MRYMVYGAESYQNVASSYTCRPIQPQSAIQPKIYEIGKKYES